MAVTHTHTHTHRQSGVDVFCVCRAVIGPIKTGPVSAVMQRYADTEGKDALAAMGTRSVLHFLSGVNE